MNPSYFGPPGEQLLGIHHAPRGNSRGIGVVLCPPAPHEATRSHWAFRKLAEQLTKAGFDVLRFDYRGTGDSAGDLADTTPGLWTEDIKRAVRELKDISGVRKVSAVGFRFGALLLAKAAGEGLMLDTIVLWEPVVSVANWFARLELIDDELRRAMITPAPRGPGELMGFVLPPALEAQWKALDLALLPRWTGGQTAIVSSTESAHLRRLKTAFEASGQSAVWHTVSSDGVDAGQGALLGNAALAQIVTVLGDRR